MATIVNTSTLQKTIGQLLGSITRSWLIVTNKGKARAIVLPYFDDNEEAVEQYLEEYEMSLNAPKLRRELRASLQSGLSSLRI